MATRLEGMMSSAEWNVLGLLLNFSGLLLLLRNGLPKQGSAQTSWLGLVLLVAGTLCQIWANIRWIG
jgi:hypothetical protein